MRKFVAFTILAAGLAAYSFAFAEGAYDDLQSASQSGSTFDGGSGSTLDAPSQSTDFQGQGTWHAEENS